MKIEWNITMRKKSIALYIQFALALFLLPSCSVLYGPAGDHTGINKLDHTLLSDIDQRIHKTLINYDYLSVALVRNGQIVLTKSYGHNRLNKRDVYASVSKPVTAMILLQLIEQGKISSLDDDIAQYHPKYKNVMPKEYSGTHITFRQLLTHTSGVPHQSKLWENGKLKLAFRPGQNVKYSSHGYGILGDVMEEITGLSYKQLVKDYIGKPIDAKSLTVLLPFFDAPAGQVASTIEDMARFAIAVMDGRYISQEMLHEEVLKRYSEDSQGLIGLGWYCNGLGTSDLAGYHAGSNGRPRAFLAIKPYKKNAVALTGLNRSEKGAHDFGNLTIDLMAIIEDRYSDESDS
jgi:CubicO group peptidase (beta-lactamase class C family)